MTPATAPAASAAPAAASAASAAADPGAAPDTAGFDSPGLRRLGAMAGLDSARTALRTRLRQLTTLRQAGTAVEGLANVAIQGTPGSGRRALAGVYGRCLAELGLLPTGAVHRLPLSQVPVRWSEQPVFHLAAALREAEGGLLVAELDPLFVQRPAAERGHVLDALARLAPKPHGAVLVVSGSSPHLLDVLTERPELAEAFAEYVELDPYGAEQLALLLDRQLRNSGFRLGDEAAAAAIAMFTARPPARGAYEVHRLAEQLAATARTRTLTPDDLPGPAAQPAQTHPTVQPAEPLVHS
ncbi:hypothetical protein GXW82_14410 [Streptacidiphilus sp. 4-A2]|nr:hypothetical protein [Streptacidiphilus sp. 4-A2]